MPQRRPRNVRRDAIVFASPEQVFPIRMPVVLRYAQHQLCTASVSFFGQTFRLNSCFDPDQTGVGAQPNYFDQLSALYQNYRVLKAKYTVKLVPRTGTGGLLAIGMSTSTTAAIIGSAEAAAALPLSKATAFGGTGSLPVTISGVVKVGDVYGMTEAQIMSDPNFLAATSANIGNAVYAGICVDTNGSTDTFSLETIIDFYVIFEKRQYQAQS